MEKRGTWKLEGPGSRTSGWVPSLIERENFQTSNFNITHSHVCERLGQKPHFSPDDCEKNGYGGSLNADWELDNAMEKTYPYDSDRSSQLPNLSFLHGGEILGMDRTSALKFSLNAWFSFLILIE